MGYINTDFKSWEPVNEAFGPGRTKQTAGLGQRVVAIPIDNDHFKIKMIRDLDIIEKDGKTVRKEGMNGVIKWLRGQIKWSNFTPYSGLYDFRKNFLVYSINRDNKRAQVITCRITPRSEAEKLPEDQNYVASHELSRYTKNENILTDIKKVDGTLDDDTNDLAATVIDAPLALTELSTVEIDSQLFNLVKHVYIKFVEIEPIAKLPFMPQVLNELRVKKKLGDATKKMIEGIIAGFDIKDEFKVPADEINFDVVNRMIQIAGKDKLLTESIAKAKPAKTQSMAIAKSGHEIRGLKGFDLKAFTAVVQPTKEEKVTSVVDPIDAAKQTISEIRIPKDGGMNRDTTPSGDPNLKKIQSYIGTVFSTKLAKSPLFIKFKKYGADGKYGPTTETMIAALKAGYGMKDTSGTTITKPFLDTIVNVDINESVLTLSYTLFEAFDVAAFTAASTSYKPVGKQFAAKKAVTTSAKDNSAVGSYTATGPIVTVKNGYVNVRNSAAVNTGTVNNLIMKVEGKGTEVGKIIQTRLVSDPQKRVKDYIWYYLELKPVKAKSRIKGWVREDTVVANGTVPAPKNATAAKKKTAPVKKEQSAWTRTR